MPTHLTVIAIAALSHQVSGAATAKIRRLKRPSLDYNSPIPLKVSANESVLAAWVAEPFGECVAQCSLGNSSSSSGFRSRTVRCRSIRNEPLEDIPCFGMPRPCTLQACDCTFSACSVPNCNNQSETTLQSRHSNLSECEQPFSGYDFTCLGCFSLQPGDNTDPPKSVMDSACVHWNSTNGTRCRSGLPFYRMLSNALTPTLCFEFCTGIGLDLFAIVQSSECRCGASWVNQGIWRRTEGIARPYLELPWPIENSCDVSVRIGCPVRVYRFSGPFESGGSIPVALLKPRAADVAYLDSILTGTDIFNGGEESPRISMKSVVKANKPSQDGKPSWTRLCDDDVGCNAGAPWTERTSTAPASVTLDKWQEYVIVRYTFDPDQKVDDARKEAFRSATAVWSQVTCVQFLEQSSPEMPYVKVGIYDTGSCYATVLGSPGNESFTQVNLGWCNSMLTRGSMVHELGHVMGLAHTQTRPDASQTYFGKGPFLEMRWSNIPNDWVPQYMPDMEAYTGSADDGNGDIQIGWAPYDFESIMHYPKGSSNSISTRPNGKFDNLIGNRQRLSKGDITMVLDTYRCVQKAGVTRPPPPSAFASKGGGFSVISKGQRQMPAVLLLVAVLSPLVSLFS